MPHYALLFKKDARTAAETVTELSEPMDFRLGRFITQKPCGVGRRLGLVFRLQHDSNGTVPSQLRSVNLSALQEVCEPWHRDGLGPKI